MMILLAMSIYYGAVAASSSFIHSFKTLYKLKQVNSLSCDHTPHGR